MARLAVPGVVGALMQSALMVIEAGYLQRVGTEALASVAVVFPLVMLAAMFSAGAIGGAVSGATARAMGAGDLQQAGSVLSSAIIIGIVGGIVMGLLVIIVGPVLFFRTAESAAVAAAATTYAAVVFVCIPLLWLVNMLCAVLRGTGDMIRPAIVLGVMVVAYAIIGAILIPRQGDELFKAMQLAGLSMGLAYFVALLLAIFFVLQKSQPVRLRFGAGKNADSISAGAEDSKNSQNDSATSTAGVLRSVLSQGLLASSQSVMTIAYALTATYLFSRHGTDWLAGYGLAVRLELVMVPMVFGIGSALIAYVGAHVGAGKRAEAVSIAWRGVLINGAIVGLIGLVFALWPSLWCSPLASSTAVADTCSQSLRVIGPTYGFFALGLGSYFASQALNTLVYPVAGALLRLLIVASGLLWYQSTQPPSVLLYLVASAVIAYGIFVVLSLWYGPWRPGRDTGHDS